MNLTVGRLCLPPLPWAVVEGDVLHGVGRRRGRREGGAERPSGRGHGGRGTEGGALAEEGHGEGRLISVPRKDMRVRNPS